MYVTSLKSSYERTHYYEIVCKEPATLININSFTYIFQRFSVDFQVNYSPEHLWKALIISECSNYLDVKIIISICICLITRQPHKMVKHTQTIRWQQPTNCLSVLDHFVGLALKELIEFTWSQENRCLWEGLFVFMKWNFKRNPKYKLLSFVVRSNLFKKRSKLKLTEKRNVLETTVFLE